MFRKRSAENSDVPIMVHRVIDDIDEIVRAVRLDGWQATHADEREAAADSAQWPTCSCRLTRHKLASAPAA